MTFLTNIMIGTASGIAIYFTHKWIQQVNGELTFLLRKCVENYEEIQKLRSQLAYNKIISGGNHSKELEMMLKNLGL